MLEKLTNADEVYIYLALFIVVFIVSWLLSLLLSKGKKAVDATKVTGRHAVSFTGALIFLLVIVIIFLLLSVNRMYTAFTSHQLIAMVECRPIYGQGSDAFELLLTPVVNGEPQEVQSYILKGEKWSVGGDILEWQSYMNFLGLRSMYRLTRVQGHYVHADDEMTRDITAYSLVEEEESDFWMTLYNIAVKAPFIKSAHQNFVSTYPYFGYTFQIYVTPSGFTLERFEKVE